MALMLRNGRSLSQTLRLGLRHSTTAANPKTEAVPESSSDWFNQEVEADIEDRVVPKPVSYRPDHLPQCRRRQHQKPWWKFRYFVDIDTVPQEASEWTEEPQYPAIYDSTTQGIKKEIRKEWYKAIRRLPTADEKIYEITKHYRHLSYFIEPVFKQYNMLPMQKAITKTKLVDGLPDSYEALEPVDPQLKAAILQTIKNRLYSVKTRPTGQYLKKSHLSHLSLPKAGNAQSTAAEEDIIGDVVELIRNWTGSDTDVHIDHIPSVATSWWLNDSPIPFKKHRWFQKRKVIDQIYMYRGTHALHLRTQLPLPKVLEPTDPLCSKPEVDSSTIDEPQPEVQESFEVLNLLRQGVYMNRYTIQSLPGFWPGKSGGYDFPSLITHTREGLRLRVERNGRDFREDDHVLDGQAITSAFATLTSAANNLGFSIYDSLTYPLVSNVLSTDGQHWSFHVYQLNKFNFHSDVEEGRNVNNVCWKSGDLKLFERIGDDGEMVGVNERVLGLLVKFIKTTTVKEPEVELRPYLGEDLRTPEEKIHFEYTLRKRFSNISDSFTARRKKTNLWETIYKNHHKAPPDNKKIRPKLDYQYPPFFN